MRVPFYVLLIALQAIFGLSAHAYWQSRAQVSVAAAGFQGPGDIVSGALAWGSCARAYNAAYANGTNPLCDLVAVTAGAAVCTLRVQTNGFVDLTGSYCIGTLTPATACAAALGGSCKVTKVYDQTGAGNHFTQATLASMPALTFSALNSLPGMTFAASQTLNSGNITQAQPFTLSIVGSRTGATTTQQLALGTSGGTIVLGFSTNINTALLTANTGNVTGTAADTSFHALQGVVNGASSSLVVDGSATSGNPGNNSYSATPIRIGGASGGTAGQTGTDMEAGVWPSAFNATQYGNVDANQHGTNGYNF